MVLYHEGEWELEAHTRSSCSTHGYFESWRDELLTPSQCWDSEISCFAHWCWSKPNVNYLRKSSYFCSEFHQSILIDKKGKPKKSWLKEFAKDIKFLIKKKKQNQDKSKKNKEGSKPTSQKDKNADNEGKQSNKNRKEDTPSTNEP